jgi:hypothetical protein
MTNGQLWRLCKRADVTSIASTEDAVALWDTLRVAVNDNVVLILILVVSEVTISSMPCPVSAYHQTVESLSSMDLDVCVVLMCIAVDICCLGPSRLSLTLSINHIELVKRVVAIY